MIDSIQNALKYLYIALGGNADNVRDENDVNDLIRLFAGLDFDGEPELPEVSATDNGDVLTVVEGEWAAAAPNVLPTVTAEDNGDVLTVVDGEWAAAAPSGGSGVLVVTDIDGTLDKTWKEISDTGYAVLNDGTNHLFPLYFLVSQGGMYGCIFLRISDNPVQEIIYAADAEDGYPSLMDVGGQ